MQRRQQHYCRRCVYVLRSRHKKAVDNMRKRYYFGRSGRRTRNTTIDRHSLHCHLIFCRRTCVCDLSFSAIRRLTLKLYYDTQSNSWNKQPFQTHSLDSRARSRASKLLGWKALDPTEARNIQPHEAIGAAVSLTFGCRAPVSDSGLTVVWCMSLCVRCMT